MNSARQSIHGAPNRKVEDTRTALGNQFMGLRIRFGVEDRRTVLGNQFMGLQTRWWRMHEQC